MKTIVITIMFGVLLMTSVSSWGGDRENLFRELQKEVSEINKSMPMMISNEIQLTRIIARSDREIAYIVKTVLYSKEQIDTRLLETNLKPPARNRICSNPKTLRLAKKGITLTHVYYDKSDKYIGEFSVTPKECGL